ncbi:transposase [methane-oxidizing endosymbiont of Gigantopelta aegis]|uniref:transposase n=1 Tax=methane-oxidizing endosymbiont of Gigantopelta aegis TaxID=2794938 RepID=UPI00315B259C
MKKAAKKYGCLIHAYVLMSNHVHLLITPENRESVSRFFQYIGRIYVAYINKSYGRTNIMGRAL